MIEEVWNPEIALTAMEQVQVLQQGSCHIWLENNFFQKCGLDMSFLRGSTAPLSISSQSITHTHTIYSFKSMVFI